MPRMNGISKNNNQNVATSCVSTGTYRKLESCEECVGAQTITTNAQQIPSNGRNTNTYNDAVPDTVISDNRDNRDTASLDSGCESNCTNGSHGSGSGKFDSLDHVDMSEHLEEEPDVIPRSTKSINGDADGDDVSLETKHEEELVRRQSASVLEVKEHAHTRLREELLRAEEELKLKDEECKKLSRVHDQMSEELEELTAKLFEEANKMVQDANIKRMNSEKLLAESNNKIEVLQAEVTALKTLVITSTPSMPNRHLHPQIGESSTCTKPPEFVKGHRRSTSHHNFFKEVRSCDASLLPIDPRKQDDCIREIDPIIFEEFQKWRNQPTLKQDAVFMSRLMMEDITPCLTFTNAELSQRVFLCVMSNSLTMEPVHERNPFPKRCALTQATRLCKYRVKLTDSEPYYPVSQLARNRIASVCDLLSYVRYIIQGLVKADESVMYWEVMRLRKQISLARLGFS